MTAYAARPSRRSRSSKTSFTSGAASSSSVAKPSARSLVLDGEVAIYDQQLWSRFEWLRERDADTAASASGRPLYHGTAVQ
jgi:hypothetical protein